MSVFPHGKENGNKLCKLDTLLGRIELLKLYGYWRSSAAYRVRIALHLKELIFEQESINLAPHAKSHMSEAFKKLNPQMRVPVLQTPDGLITQSMAVLEWIEETQTGASLLPVNAYDRAKCRAYANLIASDVHPLNIPAVLQTLHEDFSATKEQQNIWYSNWIHRGFEALENFAREGQSPFFFGEMPTFAEICLVPQIYNARRYSVDLSGFPKLLEIDEACRALKAFDLAAPENQPDAVVS